MFLLVSGDHEADWFRTTEDGHGGLDYSRPASHQVTPRPPASHPDSFVRVNGNRFEINGKEFIFAGWNQWEVMEASNNCNLPAIYRARFDATTHGPYCERRGRKYLKVVRIWMHTIMKGIKFRHLQACGMKSYCVD